MQTRRVFCGNDLVTVSLPDETRLIGPPPPQAAMEDYESALRAALREPMGMPALGRLVRPGDRVTIAFDDPCLPLPPMKRDVRGRAVEVILEELFRAGVGKDRVRLVCANGLHRQWTPRELRHLLGGRVWKEMGSERITCHDAEDPEGIVDLGESPSGHPVRVNRLVRDSDLLVYVNVNWTPMNGGWKSVLVGLGAYESIRCHHNIRVLGQGTLMDPERSGHHRIMEEMGRVVSARARVFTVETVLNNRLWGPWASRLFALGGEEGGGGRGRWVALWARAGRALPEGIKDGFSRLLRSAYEPVAVHAGRVEEVHRATLEALRDQEVSVEGQTDALFVGLPDISPYSVFSRINPILAANMALGYVFNLHRRRPVIRQGGVMIVMNPFRPGFHRGHHPSYVEFYDRVLPQTRDPAEIEEAFEAEFARSSRYMDLYRHHYAYHGVHPLYAWAWGWPGVRHLARVIVVGAQEPAAVERLGFTAVPILERALDMAGEVLGKGYSLSHLLVPPVFVTEVL